ncbi:hypothetical protein HMPREF0299_5951 [Corynebacterium matruchotii ATCC 14266]|uniref:Uncharacterized protein n=1 Tax=Corynebacterium matruchotii ATCC 14266 TaxID=553207 RepID=E0DCA2_9CORY|nr:hypothetical protein HMPREF0299_5951 [Corynebacterium matruchotii ATCC 14266]
MEPPPRARRILCTTADFCDVFGTTSACAENTGPFVGFAFIIRELPPRARRIPAEVTADPRTLGTTSACAENTSTNSRSTTVPWNYLRVRGEYSTVVLNQPLRVELPPRARRIQALNRAAVMGGGTTSACAENTAPGRR